MQQKPITAGFDTETTGLNLFHGDLPFMVCFTFNQSMPELNGKNQITWEWSVDPMTRIPQYNHIDVLEIIQWLKRADIVWYLHNAKFDSRAIDRAIDKLVEELSVFPVAEFGRKLFELATFDPYEFLDRCHCTALMSHALNNQGSHGLKDLGIRYLNIGEDDVYVLKEQVEACYPLAEQLGWKIASHKNCPLVTSKPDGGWWVMDMWLPRATFEYLDRYGIHETHIDEMPDNLKTLYHSLLDGAGNFKNYCNRYCLRDTERTLGLGEFCHANLNTDTLQEAYKLNRDQLPVAYKMEDHGLTLLMDKVQEEQARLTGLAQQFHKMAIRTCHHTSLNLNSTEQVARTLRSAFNVNVERYTALGNPTIDKDEAEELYQKVEAEMIATGDYSKLELRNFLFYYLAYKKCTKAADQDLTRYRRNAIKEPDGTYVNRFNFNIAGTDTVRYSSDGGQNIGKGKAAFIAPLKDLGLSLRKVFGPRQGYKWICIDGKQMQIAIAGYRSGVKFLREAVERGDDLHEVVHLKLAELLGWVYNRDDEGQRTIAKNCNLGYLFGAGEDRVDEQAHTPGLYADLKRNLPEAREIVRRDIKFVEEHGYIMAGPYRLYVPKDKPYAATVYCIQGLEGVIIKRAMRNIYDWCNKYPVLDCTLIHQNHDEVIVEVPMNEDPCVIPWLVYYVEEAGLYYGIPCKADVKVVTTNWSEGVKLQKGSVA